MHPHPPAFNRKTNIPNIKSRTYQKFPGMGDSIRSPGKPASSQTVTKDGGNSTRPPGKPSSKQTVTKDGCNTTRPPGKPSSKQTVTKDGINTRPPGKPSSKQTVTKDGSKSSTKQNSRKEDRIPKPPLKPVTTKSSSSSSKHRNPTKIDPVSSVNWPYIEGLERRESLSKYQLLPAINDKTEKHENKNKSNKRTFETWSADNKSPIKHETIEKDDILLDNIKRMKLGGDSFFSSGDVCLPDNELNSQPVKNPFDKKKCKEPSQSDTPGTSSIELIIRLPDGVRTQHCFSSTDTVGSVLEYLSKIMKKKIELKTFVLYTNEVPKRELKSRKSSLVALGIQDKSVLALDTRDSPTK